MKCENCKVEENGTVVNLIFCSHHLPKDDQTVTLMAAYHNPDPLKINLVNVPDICTVQNVMKKPKPSSNTYSCHLNEWIIQQSLDGCEVELVFHVDDKKLELNTTSMRCKKIVENYLQQLTEEFFQEITQEMAEEKLKNLFCLITAEESVEQARKNLNVMLKYQTQRFTATESVMLGLGTGLVGGGLFGGLIGSAVEATVPGSAIGGAAGLWVARRYIQDNDHIKIKYPKEKPFADLVAQAQKVVDALELKNPRDSLPTEIVDERKNSSGFRKRGPGFA